MSGRNKFAEATAQDLGACVNVAILVKSTQLLGPEQGLKLMIEGGYVPIYVYEREDGVNVEHIHKYGEWLSKCPETELELKRIEFPGANFQLAGGGWAKDGYASRKKPPSGRTINSHIDEHRADLKAQKESYRAEANKETR